MNDGYDCIVVGVGGMGSAAVSHLAARGVDVLGLEQFDIPHTRGSSRGYSRIVRLAYFEDPRYVPLLLRSYERWEELDRQYGDLLFETGSVSGGPGDGRMYPDARESCEAYGIDHERLDPEALQDRFVGYELPADYRRSTSPTVGAWSGAMLDVLDDSVRPERQVLGWFQPTDPSAFAPDRFPVFTLEVEEGEFYGFPIHGVPGFKLGRHHHLGETADPGEMDREPTREDERVLRQFVGEYFPSAAGPTMRLETCMYANSPDEQFIIDAHPDHANVFFAAGFSGHGFKFCPVVGEILADLAVDGETEHDVGLFRLDRF